MHQYRELTELSITTTTTTTTAIATLIRLPTVAGAANVWSDCVCVCVCVVQACFMASGSPLIIPTKHP